ncbi:MAG TPA: sialidase family protein [Streptosporangiaceae bacterium]|nr:sialidase family protein [Streptosporangiaceae bacterium]
MVSALVVGGGGYGLYSVLSGGEPETPAAPRVSQLADPEFAVDTNASDGLNQSLSDVATVGNTVVAAGTETGGTTTRPRFLFSADNGRTWQPAKVTVESGNGASIRGNVDAVVGAQGAWLALGGLGDDRFIWTSSDGRVWSQLRDRITAFRAGDRISQITRATQGYIAVGYRGDGPKSSPIVWLSRDGRSWQRLDGENLKLTAKAGSANRLRYVAASGARLLISGDVIKAKSTVAGIWRSTDGGRTWTALTSPSPNNVFGPIHLGANSSGFVAMREGKQGTARLGVVFSSSTGDTWRPVGNITTSAGAGVTFRHMTVGDQAFAVLSTGPGSRAAVYQSTDGANWRQAVNLPDNRTRTLAKIATTGDTAVLVGALDQNVEQNGYLAVTTGPESLTEIDVNRIPGAAARERSVRDVLAAGGRTIAVGSGNGKAAAWASPDGVTWNRADTGTLGGAGRQGFIKVTHGPRGWFAIGAERGKPFAAGSTDGRSWQRVDGRAFSAGKDETIRLSSTTYGPKGYIVIGTITNTKTGAASAVAWHSVDLQNWRSSGAEEFGSKDRLSREILGIAAGPSGYIAVGEVSDPAKPAPTRSRPAIWTSIDGLNWTDKKIGLPDEAAAGRLSYVAIKGNTVVAAGEATFTGTRAFVVTSSDLGATWRATRLPAPVPGQPTYLSGITSTTKGIVIVGTLGGTSAGDVLVWNSPNGGTWHPSAPKGVGLSGNGYQRINGLTQLGDRLLGVGTTTDGGTEHITLWRPPVG